MASHSDSRPLVLVTGLSGFTGDYLRASLTQAGYRVAGFGAPGGALAPDCEPVDLADLDTLRRRIGELAPEYVIHLAAISFVAHADINEIYRVNLFGTLNLLQAIHEAGVAPRKVVIASTANVYGNPPVEVVDESVVPMPVNHYGNSKLAMEYMVRTWFDRMPIIITRPFNYTGLGQGEHFLIPKIVSHFKRKAAVLELGNTDVVRDFSDVRFVAEAYRGLLETPASGEIVNLCSDTGYSLTQLLQWLADNSGHQPEIRINPAFVRANEIRVLIGSNAKLKQLVPGLAPCDFLATLDWMFKS